MIWWVSKFDIMENNFFIFLIMFIYVFTYILISHNMIIPYIYLLYFPVSNGTLFFISALVLTLYIDVVFMFSVVLFQIQFTPLQNAILLYHPVSGWYEQHCQQVQWACQRGYCSWYTNLTVTVVQVSNATVYRILTFCNIFPGKYFEYLSFTRHVTYIDAIDKDIFFWLATSNSVFA